MYNNDFQNILKTSTKTCPAAWTLRGDLQTKDNKIMLTTVDKNQYNTLSCQFIR